jgi:hypothetical protein
MPVERRTRIVVDHGVAPECFMPVERRTQKGSRSCEEQVGKGISHSWTNVDEAVDLVDGVATVC